MKNLIFRECENTWFFWAWKHVSTRNARFFSTRDWLWLCVILIIVIVIMRLCESFWFLILLKITTKKHFSTFYSKKIVFSHFWDNFSITNPFWEVFSFFTILFKFPQFARISRQFLTRRNFGLFWNAELSSLESIFIELFGLLTFLSPKFYSRKAWLLKSFWLNFWGKYAHNLFFICYSNFFGFLFYLNFFSFRIF